MRGPAEAARLDSEVAAHPVLEEPRSETRQDLGDHLPGPVLIHRVLAAEATGQGGKDRTFRRGGGTEEEKSEAGGDMLFRRACMVVDHWRAKALSIGIDGCKQVSLELSRG